MAMTINEICKDWGHEDMAALAFILKLPEDKCSISHIENTIKWHFHSSIRANLKAGMKNIIPKLMRSKKEHKVEDQYTGPTYLDLMDGVLGALKTDCKGATLADKEVFLSQAVIAQALVNMSPQQRRRAFAETLELSEIVEHSDSLKDTFARHKAAAGAITIANAAGFSLYTSSTMALSFATSMAGITLPFAVYTGMTTFLSVIIGPAGWAAISGASFWKFTEPDWESLKIALLFIISVRSRDVSSKGGQA